jgi:hypothetical protein
MAKTKSASIIDKIQAAIVTVESEIQTLTDCLNRLALEDQAAADGIPIVAAAGNDLFSKISGAVAAANDDVNAAAAAQLRQQLRAETAATLEQKKARRDELISGLELEEFKAGAAAEIATIDKMMMQFNARAADLRALETAIKTAPRTNIEGLAARRGVAAVVSGSIGRWEVEGTAANLHFVNRA